MDYMLTIKGWDSEKNEDFEHKEKLVINHPQELTQKVATILTTLSFNGLTRQTSFSTWIHTPGRVLHNLVASVSSIIVVGASENVSQLISR